MAMAEPTELQHIDSKTNEMLTRLQTVVNGGLTQMIEWLDDEGEHTDFIEEILEPFGKSILNKILDTYENAHEDPVRDHYFYLKIQSLNLAGGLEERSYRFLNDWFTRCFNYFKNALNETMAGGEEIVPLKDFGTHLYVLFMFVDLLTTDGFIVDSSDDEIQQLREYFDNLLN